MNVGILVGFFLTLKTVYAQSSRTALPPLRIVEELSNLPESVTNCAVTSIFKNNQQYIYVFGGIDSSLKSSGIHSRCYRVNVNDKFDKIRLPDIPDSLGKIALSATRVGTMAYIIGGYHVFPNGNEKSSKLVHEFDLIGDTFTFKKIELPLAIDDHIQGLWNDSLIFIVNGWSDSTNVRYTQIYNPKSNSWSIGTPMDTSMTSTFGASGAVVGNTIFIQGGARSDLPFFPSTHYYFKGEIDPNQPTNVSWSGYESADSNTTYRSALYTLGRSGVIGPEVIGGSIRSYNYNGLDYRFNSLVKPLSKSVKLNDYKAESSEFEIDYGFDINIPLDVRDWTTLNFTEPKRIPGIGFGDSVIIGRAMFIAGGINHDGTVSNKIIRISYASVVSTDENSEDIEFKVYPNPTSGIVKISYSKPANVCRIFNSFGKQIAIVNKTAKEIKIDLSQEESGLYFYHDASNNLLIKLIKK